MQPDTQVRERNELLFLGGCLPARLAVAGVALSATGENSTRLRYLAAVPAAVWLSGLLDYRDTGFFQGDAWWAPHRKMHGLLWALYAATGRGEILLGDALLGVWYAAEHRKKSSEPVSIQRQG